MDCLFLRVELLFDNFTKLVIIFQDHCFNMMSKENRVTYCVYNGWMVINVDSKKEKTNFGASRTSHFNLYNTFSQLLHACL
jgi:hypothetical protein